MDDLTGGANGVTVNSNSTLFINGILRLNGYTRAFLDASEANLIINGGLEITGNTLQQNSGAGVNITRLNGNVTTFASTNVARLGNSTDSDTFTELNGTRTFTVADGPSGLDLSVSSVVRDSTSPVATGSLIKVGPGTMQLEGGGTANSYTGTTTVNEGTLVLFKAVGVDAIPAGALTIGDGVGGAGADKVILRNSNQIADTNNVAISSSGLLDMQTYNTSETVNAIAGSGAVTLGPGSSLTLADSSGNSAVFSGSIRGGGTLNKSGTSTLELTGNNDIGGGTSVTGTGSRLVVSGTLSGGVLANSGATLAGRGTVNGAANVIGTLAPGPLLPNSGPGDLTVNGLVTFDTTSEFNLQLNGGASDTGFDQLTVGAEGSVSILGGTLTLSLGFVPNTNQQFMVIENLSSSPISGVFSNLAQGGTISATFGAVNYTFTANYAGGTGNDLVLTVPEPTSGLTLVAGLALSAGLRRFRRKS
jgi:autotransporter-associated beta strand protein